MQLLPTAVQRHDRQEQKLRVTMPAQNTAFSLTSLNGSRDDWLAAEAKKTRQPRWQTRGPTDRLGVGLMHVLEGTGRGETPKKCPSGPAIQNPDNEQHEELLEWVGGRFDPESFDPAKATKAMKKGLPDWKSMAEG
jgi:hypothetical protein